jgi:hypothetical protein
MTNMNELDRTSLKAIWDRLLTLDAEIESRRACGRIVNPLVTVVFLLCGALTISPVTWLNAICTDAQVLANTTGWVRTVADKWMALGLYDHYGRLFGGLALFVAAVPLLIGLLAKKILPSLYKSAGKRSTEELSGNEVQYLRRIKEKSTSAGYRMTQDLRSLSWNIACIGSIALGVLFAVTTAAYEFISSDYAFRHLLTGVLLGAILGAVAACVYLVLYLPAWYLGTVHAAFGLAEPVEKIRTDAERQLARCMKELEQADREHKATEMTRRKQEKEARVQRILQEADGLFARRMFAEAMRAYQPLAEELVPRGRAGYLLSRVAVARKPDLKECRPIAEELRRLEKMDLPVQIRTACRNVADKLVEMIREECTPRFHRAQELIHLGMDSSALTTLKEIAELGMPEAVLMYVSTAVKMEISKEQYPELICLLDMAGQLGFSAEAAKKAYRVMQPKLNYDYGRYLVGRGQKSDGESYIRVAANMGSEEAARYLEPPHPVATYGPAASTSGRDDKE